MRDVRTGRSGGFSGLGEWLKGPECKRLVESKANEAMLLYQAIVSKRSGELARSAKARTRISGDRYVGVVEVEASYAASHEFGHDQRGVRRDGFDELREVLKNLED